MKNLFFISLLLLLVGSFFTSCSPITDADLMGPGPQTISPDSEITFRGQPANKLKKNFWIQTQCDFDQDGDGDRIFFKQYHRFYYTIDGTTKLVEYTGIVGTHYQLVNLTDSNPLVFRPSYQDIIDAAISCNLEPE